VIELKKGKHTKWDLELEQLRKFKLKRLKVPNEFNFRHIKIEDVLEAFADVHIACHEVDEGEFDCEIDGLSIYRFLELFIDYFFKIIY